MCHSATSAQAIASIINKAHQTQTLWSLELVCRHASRRADTPEHGNQLFPCLGIRNRPFDGCAVCWSSECVMRPEGVCASFCTLLHAWRLCLPPRTPLAPSTGRSQVLGRSASPHPSVRDHGVRIRPGIPMLSDCSAADRTREMPSTVGTRRQGQARRRKNRGYATAMWRVTTLTSPPRPLMSTCLTLGQKRIQDTRLVHCTLPIMNQ